MNTFLETGISLVLVFFIFSIITYVIQELIAVNLRFRSKMLWKSLSQLFDKYELIGREKLIYKLPKGETPETDTFYNHPQIQSLQKDLKKMPSYIPSANFALAIMDIVAKRASPQTGVLFDDFKSGLKTFADSKGNIYDVLKNLLDTSSTIKQLQLKIENWFDKYMKRVSGWYESHTVVWVRSIAVVLTVVFNINVIKLAKTIYKDGQLRSSMVAMAEGVVDNPETVTQYYTSSFNIISSLQDSLFQKKIAAATSDAEKQTLIKAKADTLDKLAQLYTEKRIAVIQSFVKGLDTTRLPLGWKDDTWKKEIKGKENSNPFINLLLMLAGWIIAACCISMGAPFWFDTLNKLVNVRRTVS